MYVGNIRESFASFSVKNGLYDEAYIWLNHIPVYNTLPM